MWGEDFEGFKSSTWTGKVAHGLFSFSMVKDSYFGQAGAADRAWRCCCASPAHWGSPGAAAALPTGVSGWELQFWAGFVGICDPRAPKGP